MPRIYSAPYDYTVRSTLAELAWRGNVAQLFAHGVSTLRSAGAFRTPAMPKRERGAEDIAGWGNVRVDAISELGKALEGVYL